jgi:hypothetical protein
MTDDVRINEIVAGAWCRLADTERPGVVGIDAPAVRLVMGIRLFFGCRVGYSVVLRLSGRLFGCSSIVGRPSGNRNAGEPPGEFRQALLTGGLPMSLDCRRDERGAASGDAPSGLAGAAGDEAGAMDRALGGGIACLRVIHRDCSFSDGPVSRNPVPRR